VKTQMVVHPNGIGLMCAPCAVVANGDPSAGWCAFQTPSARFAAEHMAAHDARGDEIDPAERVKLDAWLEDKP